MKASYPVILTPAGHGYVVFVPDLNINTEGGTLAEALDMVRDAISIWGISEQDAGRTISEASNTIPTAASGQIVQRVDVDFEAYRRETTTSPACFYKENDGYSVIFPDLNYLATQGGAASGRLCEWLRNALRAICVLHSGTGMQSPHRLIWRILTQWPCPKSLTPLCP